MSGLEPFLLAASAGIGAVTSVASGIQQNNIAKANAAQLNAESEAVRQQAILDERNQRRNAAQVLAKQRAGAAANGLGLSGSALDIMSETAFEAEVDALNIRNSANAKALSLNNQAAMQRHKGQVAQTAGYLKGASTLLKGTSSMSWGDA